MREQAGPPVDVQVQAAIAASHLHELPGDVLTQLLAGARRSRVDAGRTVKPHDDFAVHDMDRVFPERDHFDRVPLAARLLVVGHLHAAARLSRALREIRPHTVRIVFVERRLNPGTRFGFDRNHGPDRIEIADVPFLNLKLDRSCPRPPFRSGFGVHVVKQAAIPLRRCGVARRPLLLSPFELQPQAVVLERRFRPELAEHLARDANRGAAVDVGVDREHLQRIAIGSDRLRVSALGVFRQSWDVGRRRWPLHPGRPSVQILAVPERLPVVLRASRRADEQARQDHGRDENSVQSHCTRSLARFVGRCQVSGSIEAAVPAQRRHDADQDTGVAAGKRVEWKTVLDLDDRAVCEPQNLVVGHEGDHRLRAVVRK